jgi:hypothetical protein
MEGVNMPASYKFAWRWIVGATAVTIVSLVALPGVGQATNIEICINNSNGRIKGINLGDGACDSATQEEIDWVTTGPAGYTGAYGVQGNPGIAGAQGPQGYAGSAGPAGGQGQAGPQGPEGVAGPTGPTGPAGIMGENGVRGPTGVVGATGLTGPSGTPGIPEPNISVFTGGTMGTFGSPPPGPYNVGLSGLNSVTVATLAMGPGNGSDTSPSTSVPMSETGTASRLFVRVDTDPGTQMTNGQPSMYVFELCDGAFQGNCALTCTIVGPDTTCSDLTHSQPFPAVGDVMTLFAYSTYFLANQTDVTWSVTYDHGAAIVVPVGVVPPSEGGGL